MLSPSETCGKVVVGVKYSNGMLQGNKCCCCCLYAEQIGKKKTTSTAGSDLMRLFRPEGKV